MFFSSDRGVDAKKRDTFIVLGQHYKAVPVELSTSFIWNCRFVLKVQQMAWLGVSGGKIPLTDYTQ